MTLFLIIIVLLFIEYSYSPRLGYTREGSILLWYGKRNRKYVVILG